MDRRGFFGRLVTFFFVLPLPSFLRAKEKTWQATEASGNGFLFIDKWHEGNRYECRSTLSAKGRLPKIPSVYVKCNPEWEYQHSTYSPSYTSLDSDGKTIWCHVDAIDVYVRRRIV